MPVLGQQPWRFQVIYHEAEAASIDTRDEKRDAHLRSPDFFAVEQYPLLTFKSEQVEPLGESRYSVGGDLTLHGVTREVTFEAAYGGQIPKEHNSFGDWRAGLSAVTTINRKDFGLPWNFALETGGWMVGEEVRIEINLEAITGNEALVPSYQKAEFFMCGGAPHRT